MEATHLSHTKLSCIQTSWINISSMVFQGNGVTLRTCIVSAVRGPVAATFIELSPTPGRLAEVEEDTNWSQDFHWSTLLEFAPATCKQGQLLIRVQDFNLEHKFTKTSKTDVSRFSCIQYPSILWWTLTTVNDSVNASDKMNSQNRDWSIMGTMITVYHAYGVLVNWALPGSMNTLCTTIATFTCSVQFWTHDDRR